MLPLVYGVAFITQLEHVFDFDDGPSSKLINKSGQLLV